MASKILMGEFTLLVQKWNDLRNDVRFRVASIILLLILIVDFIGWFTLESLSRLQRLTHQSFDLVSALRTAWRGEKNNILLGNHNLVTETLPTFKQIRRHVELLWLNLMTVKMMQYLLAQKGNYGYEFENSVELNQKKECRTKKLINQRSEQENTAFTLCDVKSHSFEFG